MPNRNSAVTVGSVLLPVFVCGAAADIANTEEISTVTESEDWAALKNIWRSIGRLEPSERYSGFPLSAEKGDSLLEIVNNLFQDAEFENPQMETSIALIRRITGLRLMRLSRVSPLLLTRMMPPWTDRVQDQLLFNFETRLATLGSLVRNGMLTPIEFTAARETLVEKAVIIAVLQLLNDADVHPYDRYSAEYSERFTVDLLLQQISMSYSVVADTLKKYQPGDDYPEYFDEAAAQYLAFQEHFREFQRAEPVFRVLLANLMGAEV